MTHLTRYTTTISTELFSYVKSLWETAKKDQKAQNNHSRKIHELCQGRLSGHLVVNGQMYATRHTDYNVGTDQGPREPRVYRRTLTGLG